MPSPTTGDEFLDLVRKSAVVDDRRLSTYLERLRGGAGAPADPVQMATQLVRDGILTHFQAEQFLQGKWRRFTIGKYKVLERLGSGGMGSVYLCEHMLMRRRVAVKVLPAAKADDPSSRERFYREARAVAALDHPNIVRAYDIDQDEELHFLVMEHVDGANLQEIVKRGGPMAPVRAAHYIRQAALGLQHAHEAAGIVHRDIKPGNILVDRNGIVKILDMGLARFFNDDDDVLTKKYDENVLGTADYLAPEQALDSHGVDIRADIYSLGGTFYFCLTGRTPFAEGTVAQKLIWHQTRQPKPIRSIRPDVPEAMAAVLERMMMKDVGQRYRTPQSVAEALEPWTQTPIPPPADAEMPQFSPAAKGLTCGENSLGTGPRPSLDAGSPSRKTWQVTGPNTPPDSTGPNASLADTKPVVLAPQPAAPPKPRATLPARAPSPAPSPTPAARPTAKVQTPVAVGAAISPVQSDVEAASPSWEKLGSENSPLAEEENPGRPRRPTRSTRTVPANGTTSDNKRKFLWWGLGLTATALVALVGFWALPGPEKKGGTETPRSRRKPILVDPALGHRLKAIVERAEAGDRIQILNDLKEDQTVHVRVRDLTIEAAEGRIIHWTCPAKAAPGFKLLVVGNAPGFALRGITLSGENKIPFLMTLYGKCPGARFENLRLEKYTRYGVYVTNCEGSEGNPVQFRGVRFQNQASTTGNKAGTTGIFFDVLPSLPDVLVNRYFSVKGCKFDGPGVAIQAPQDKFVDTKTMDFTPNLLVKP
jgi:serine/threonine protein kinase